nr:PAAR domain-containing protein [Salmonella enterica]
MSIAGLPTVFIDGLPVARMSDAVDCGGVVI